MRLVFSWIVERHSVSYIFHEIEVCTSKAVYYQEDQEDGDSSSSGREELFISHQPECRVVLLCCYLILIYEHMLQWKLIKLYFSIMLCVLC